MAGGAPQSTAGSATRPPAAGPVPLRRNRDFMVLWSSQVVSTVGTRVTSIAFPLLVLAVTHSPAKAGVVGFAQTLPFLLLYLPAGAFIDRWDRKRTMLACDAGRAVALGSIAITVALGWLSVAQVIAAALIEGSLFVLFDLAEGAALPQLVTEEQVPAAIAQNQAKSQGADVVGQPLGGVLFSAAWLLPFLVDAVTYWCPSSRCCSSAGRCSKLVVGRADRHSRVAAERPQPRRRFRGPVVCRPGIQRRCHQPRLPGDTEPAARPGTQRGTPGHVGFHPAGGPGRRVPRRGVRRPDDTAHPHRHHVRGRGRSDTRPRHAPAPHTIAGRETSRQSTGRRRPRHVPDHRLELVVSKRCASCEGPEPGRGLGAIICIMH